MTSGTAALGGLLFGYDTGVVSGALLYLKKEFGGLSSFQQELVTSMLLVGCMVGAFAGGRTADRSGRRPTLAVTALVFIAGVLMAAFAPDFPLLVIARFVIADAAPGRRPRQQLSDPRGGLRRRYQCPTYDRRVWLMDRVSRRPLLLIGTTGMLIGLLTVACAIIGGDQLTGGRAIAALMWFQGSFAIGLGPVF